MSTKHRKLTDLQHRRIQGTNVSHPSQDRLLAEKTGQAVEKILRWSGWTLAALQVATYKKRPVKTAGTSCFSMNPGSRWCHFSCEVGRPSACPTSSLSPKNGRIFLPSDSCRFHRFVTTWNSFPRPFPAERSPPRCLTCLTNCTNISRHDHSHLGQPERPQRSPSKIWTPTSWLVSLRAAADLLAGVECCRTMLEPNQKRRNGQLRSKKSKANRPTSWTRYASNQRK